MVKTGGSGCVPQERFCTWRDADRSVRPRSTVLTSRSWAKRTNCINGAERRISMSAWPKYPTIYEIDTWVWLAGLREKSGVSTDLSSVPSTDWDAIAKFGFDAVWLMGVWERSPAGIKIANKNESLLNDFRSTL